MTPLHIACVKGNLDIVKMILDSKVVPVNFPYNILIHFF